MSFKPLLVAGVCVTLLGFAMLFLTAVLFTATGPLPPWIDLLAKLSFWGFMPAILLGVVLVIIAAVARPARSK